jgi:hypothetical protein
VQCRPWRAHLPLVVPRHLAQPGRDGWPLPNSSLKESRRPAKRAAPARPRPAGDLRPASAGPASHADGRHDLKTSGLRPEPRPSSEISRGSPRRAPQGLPASPDGAKVVRQVWRSTLSPSGEAGRSGDCPTRRSFPGRSVSWLRQQRRNFLPTCLRVGARLGSDRARLGV